MALEMEEDRLPCVPLGEAPREAGPVGVPSRARLAVVVAMKPQLRGRIRRNVETLLELGLQVVVVSAATNMEFFVGLSSPLLSARLLQIKTVYGRYSILIWHAAIR